MKRWKNHLDEMQEQTMLRIEHAGVWLCFWALFAALMIQVALGAAFDQIAGELIVFLTLCVYLVARCVKAGIWDRRLKPNLKTNLLVSLLTGLATGAFGGTVNAVRFGLDAGNALLDGSVTAVFTFALCFAALSAFAFVCKRRVEKLERVCQSADAAAADTIPEESIRS